MRELPAAGAPKEHPNRPAVSDGSSGTRVAPLAGAVPSVLEPTPLGLPPSPKWLYGSVRPPERTFDETKRATQASGIDLAHGGHHGVRSGEGTGGQDRDVLVIRRRSSAGLSL
jgi:hypothetical protein